MVWEPQVEEGVRFGENRDNVLTFK